MATKTETVSYVGKPCEGRHSIGNTPVAAWIVEEVRVQLGSLDYIRGETWGAVGSDGRIFRAAAGAFFHLRPETARYA